MFQIQQLHGKHWRFGYDGGGQSDDGMVTKILLLFYERHGECLRKG
jgi:hypothetical protein